MKANFEQLLQDSNQVHQFIREEIGTLSTEQMNGKASADTWSLVEIVEHLNLVYDKYLDNMDEAVSKANPIDQEKSQSKKTTLLGSLSVYAMSPKKQQVKYKMKTFDFFDPVQNKKDALAILSQFEANNERFKSLIRQARMKNVENIKIPTSLGERIRFYLIQCIEFIIAHELRHLIQMKALLKAVK